MRRELFRSGSVGLTLTPTNLSHTQASLIGHRWASQESEDIRLRGRMESVRFIAMVANLELLKLSERSTFSEAMLQKLVDLYLITWYSFINGF